MAGPDQRELTDQEIGVLEGLLAKVGGPGGLLPWPLFRFLTEVAATVNVDLLVHDAERGVLLAWRDDPFGTGWHVPGSIVRHREEIAHRLAACAEDEFGCAVEAGAEAVAIVQIFDDRGHSVSLCYPAVLRGTPAKRLRASGDIPDPGDLCWFRTMPARLYPSHGVYAEVIAAFRGGGLGAGARLFTQHVGRRDAAQPSADATIDPGAPITQEV